jgi:hypothetical protein
VMYVHGGDTVHLADLQSCCLAPRYVSVGNSIRNVPKDIVAKVLYLN